MICNIARLALLKSLPPMREGEGEGGPAGAIRVCRSHLPVYEIMCYRGEK